MAKKKTTKKATTKKKSTTKKKPNTKKASTKKKTKKVARKKVTEKQKGSSSRNENEIKQELEKAKKENEQLKSKADLLDIDDNEESLEDMPNVIGEKTMFNFNDIDDENEFDYEENDPQLDLAANDIFEFGINLRDTENFYPEWTIKKDGAIVATKRSKYSFEQLQNEYGGGHYEIWLRDGNTKQYRKKQTQDVAEPPKRSSDDSKEQFQRYQKEDDMEKMMKLMTVMSQMQSSSSRDKAETAKAEVEAQNLSNQALMQMMTASSTQNAENMKLMMNMIKSSNDANAKMIEQLATSIKESTKKNSSEFGLKEILALQESSKKSAYREYKEMMDMAQEMVDKRMEMMEANSFNEKEEKKSSIDKLIDNFSPVVSQALVNAQKSMNSQTDRPTMPTQNQVRNAGTNQYRNVDQDIRNPSARNVGSFNRPNFIEPKQTKQKVSEQNSDHSPKLEETYKGEAMTEKHVAAIKKKEEILETVLPIVTDGLVKGSAHSDNPEKKLELAKESAEKSVKAVEATGITKKEILENFKVNDIIEIGKSYNLPKEAFPWLKDYYDEIEIRCKDDAGHSAKPVKTEIVGEGTKSLQ